MDVTVVFKVNGIEIKAVGKAPDVRTIPVEGKRNMAAITAISKIKKETGIDLYSIDEDINEKAEFPDFCEKE
ncbi:MULTISPECIES: hypothetical protein [Bacillus amyloliquefaciens group]|uniref:hypothetical protein n=1 Tax=Bacillus amyloliquefaciens group TaxID=1938374 RepID=UPI00073BE3D8|nr:MULTISPECIES: hypothetical protein [Bacillus amyloliquefaciens group]KTF59095.1 hypothetical protein AR691_17585 [Bacillus amyloliquefaciens]